MPRHVRRLAALAAPLLLGGCKMVVMNPTGDIALQERNLILTALGMMLLVIVPVMALTVIFALRYRKGRSPKDYDPNFHHSTRIEVVVWSVPLLIITCLGAVTWVSTHKLDPFRPLDRIAAGQPIPADVKPLEIQVVAMDWKWLFIYPEQGIATVNELDLPVNVPVRFSITSTSQMNTFSAPTLAGMIYAMPGMKSMLNAVLNKPGDSWGYSGNYTGRGYSDMRFQLHGVDQAGFARWVAKVKASGGDLSSQRYLVLETPSEKTPVTYFSSVAPGLFDRVVNRCVAPGAPCIADVARKDRALDRDRGGAFAMPSTGAARPGEAMPMGAAMPMGHGPASNATPQASTTPHPAP
jgi:cytochrome o ubiquinol oxidase subunit 2